MAAPKTVSPEQYVLWLLGHANDGQLIISETEAVIAAPDVPGKAAALKTLVDTLAGEFANFPTDAAPPAGAVMAKKTSFTFNPANWLAIIQMIEALINAFKPAPVTP
jgi:hypothetical protein